MESVDPVMLVLVGISEVVSLACAVRLWRRPGVARAGKLGWTAVLALPVLGPLAYGALAGGGPSVQPDELQAREADDGD